MLPGGSGSRRGDTAYGLGCGRRLVRVRRLCVSSLPASPIEAVACPTMLFFLLAFYVLHGLAVLLLQHSSALLLGACPMLRAYALDLFALAAAMALAHLARLLPNLLARYARLGPVAEHDTSTGMRASPTSGGRSFFDGQDAEDQSSEAQGWLPQAKQSPRPMAQRLGRDGTAKRWLALALFVLLEVVQRCVWAALQIKQLRSNWAAYIEIDSLLDALKLAQQVHLFAAEPAAVSGVGAGGGGLGPDGSLLCGQAGSMHLVRWTLVCIVVTTALALSFLLVVAQEAVGVARSLLCGGATGPGSKRSRRGLLARASTLLRGVTRGVGFSRRRGSDAHLDAGASPTTPAASPAGHHWLDLQTDEVRSDNEDQA